jgi:signal transduction histidine kinase/ActR/RegA family two-component response regulator
MANRLGLEPGECVGQTCYSVVHGMDQPPLFCPHAQLLKDGREHIVEAREERLGGDFIISTSPIFDSEGHLTGSVQVARDITERKMMEDKLRQAYKMEAIGTLAGGIAHDFNNILAAIVGYTEMLESSIEKESLEYDYVTQMLKAGGRAKDLVQQILAFSRESDHEFEPIQIKFPIKEALKLIRASLPATIEIQRDIQADAMVLADPTQIHQVVMNLCTNADHAMQERGGILGVSLRNADFGIGNGDLGLGNGNLKSGIGLVPGPYVKLSVSDTGCGMPPHIVTRIFDPFFTTKEKGVGTGMGLSVVHGIVKSHGGAIDVYSEPGQGTTFNVFLPALESRSEAETRVDKPIFGGSENILFVDDEHMVVDVMGKALKSLGYHVVTRTSSMEALELFQEEPDRFDMVITDMTMPKMTGRQLAEKLIQIRPNLPIILITGFSTAIDEETAPAAGIQAIIFKPILKRDIAEAVRKILDQEAKSGEKKKNLTG